MSSDYGYDLWWLVGLNSLIFIVFASLSAFIVALFTEMCGFLLTIYLLSGWLGSSVPGLDLLAHNSGHVWQDLTGWQGDPFLLQWPTLLTLLMFPIPVIVYLGLARREERLIEAEFGDAYGAYRREVPGFFPRFGRGRAGLGQQRQEGQ